jgi:hypothetical protein
MHIFVQTTQTTVASNTNEDWRRQAAMEMVKNSDNV